MKQKNKIKKISVKKLFAVLIVFVIIMQIFIISVSAAARTANFIVESNEPRLDAEFAQALEKSRHDLAIEWLGQAMPNWGQPCKVTIQSGPGLGAGGATSFVFYKEEVFGWRMTIQGSAERLKDSVIPHEVNHMILASYFKRPVPRWADEGAASSVEIASEKQKHRTWLVQFLRTGRGIAFSQMFTMTEYPKDIMPLYAQGYALSEFLIQKGGKARFLRFLDEGMPKKEDLNKMPRDKWQWAVKNHYGYDSLNALQGRYFQQTNRIEPSNSWLAWVYAGFPELPGGQQLAQEQLPEKPAGQQGQQTPVQAAQQPQPVPVEQIIVPEKPPRIYNSDKIKFLIDR